MKTTVVMSSESQAQHSGGSSSSFSISSQEERILRIERIAIRLFGVGNCIVSFGHVSERFGKGERSIAALEASFCDSLTFPGERVIVSDARLDPRTATNPWVIGPPYIRFYAIQPLFDKNVVVGGIFLVDYVARQFKEEDTFLLNDLAGLVEQELHFDSMQVAHNDLVKQNRSLRRDSMIDPLLGTWNRPAIVRSLELELQRCKAASKPVSLAMVSVDNFDALKNEFGLHAAESVLVKLVSRMRSCIRPFDALGRYGAEEFLFVLPGASHIVMQAIAERLRTNVFAHPETIDDQTRAISICIGTVSSDIFTDAGSDELVAQVEHALFSAKKGGANQLIHAALVEVT